VVVGVVVVVVVDEVVVVVVVVVVVITVVVVVVAAVVVEAVAVISVCTLAAVDVDEETAAWMQRQSGQPAPLIKSSRMATNGRL
jgi:hypothetical protein